MSEMSITPVTPLVLPELPELPPAPPVSPLEALVSGGLGDPATNGVAALGVAPEAATTVPEAQVDGGHETVQPPPSSTLALMSQQAQRPDAPAPAADTPAPRHEAAVEAGTPADAGAMPVPADLPATVAVASMLHVPATDFRSKAPPPAVDEHGRHVPAFELADEAEDESGYTPPEDPPAVPAAPVGDPALYARIVALLHGMASVSPIAAEVLGELRRQRRVVLATPASLWPGPKCPAHVDLLWPLPAGGRALRLAGELWWARVPVPDTWWCAHLVKSQPDGRTRRLVPRPGDDAARDVAVSLGTDAPTVGAGAHVCLRVRDTTRLWLALEPQWSLRVGVGTRPWPQREAMPREIGHAA